MTEAVMPIPETASDPGRLSEFAAAIADKSLSPVALLERFLARIDAVEPQVKAWRELDREGAMKVALQREQEADRGYIRGPLHGIPMGVKDIIDVSGLPTRCNSQSRANALPATADSEVVLQMKAAGAIVLGKLHTTEFAFYDPSPACNPWNLEHTPGGSSSGSGAAMGAGMVPVALGTQTMASANRPAAYCGVSNFKPSSRSLSTFGVAPLAASYDTIGVYGGRVEDAVLAFRAAMPPFMAPSQPAPADLPIKVVLLSDPLLNDMKPDMKSAYRAMADALAHAGHSVKEQASPVSFTRLSELHWSTMIFEIGHTHANSLKLEEGQIGKRLLGAIEDGLKISEAQYLDDRRELDGLRRTLLGAHLDTQVFLWPATPGGAPHGLSSTGEPKYIAPWTAIGGPIVTIPAGRGTDGLPLACIACGHPGSDAAMCDWAGRIAAAGEISPFVSR